MKLSVFPFLLILADSVYRGGSMALSLLEPMTRKLHQQAKDLKNGAALDVSISFPMINTTYDEATDIRVLGNASVGLGEPDVSYIYIIDTSISTIAQDGDCGSVLECVQKFFIALHLVAISDGSAELASVINFDDIANVSTSLQHPEDPVVEAAIEAAIKSGSSSGTTNCTGALLEAAELVKSPSNTAGTTVVVFAGDGLCNEDAATVEDAADALGKTSAIVHTVAVGDDVNCTASQNFDNNMLDIPQNGGVCHSIPDPDTLIDIIDDLIGTSLVSLELQVDNGNYTNITNANLTQALPQDGAIRVEFNTTVAGLPAGRHDICVRATGEDVLGGRAQVEDCHEFDVVAPPESAAPPGKKSNAGRIAAGVILSLGCVLLLVFGIKFARRGRKEETMGVPGSHGSGQEQGVNAPSIV